MITACDTKVESLPIPAELVDWHEQAFKRIESGIDQKIEAICAKHFVPVEFIEGWLDWFKAAHPEHHKKWWDSWNKINDLWIEGRTDAEAQKLFNEQLRIYRDGAAWVMERYVGYRKDNEATERVEAEEIGKQEKLAV